MFVEGDNNFPELKKWILAFIGNSTAFNKKKKKTCQMRKLHLFIIKQCPKKRFDIHKLTKEPLNYRLLTDNRHMNNVEGLIY